MYTQLIWVSHRFTIIDSGQTTKELKSLSCRPTSRRRRDSSSPSPSRVSAAPASSTPLQNHAGAIAVAALKKEKEPRPSREATSAQTGDPKSTASHLQAIVDTKPSPMRCLQSQKLPCCRCRAQTTPSPPGFHLLCRRRRLHHFTAHQS
ncbi:hypothetical protein M0R45_015650 [Rubus argutus]|uniref:Uncharacterized protein n=1 Tax=Rubus argutus TaxID=59490 RepID=A0AAW1XSM1_RUBAR